MMGLIPALEQVALYPAGSTLYVANASRILVRSWYSVFLKVAQPLPFHRTSGTISSFAPRNKDLLRVIPNKTCKYGESPMHCTITTRHLDRASLIEGLQRLKDVGKTIVKEVGKHSAA